MNQQDKLINIAAGIFILAVVAFGLARVQYDLRWSAWAVGDAQNLNAAEHFAKEGFKKHYFLTYYHPGFLGKYYEPKAGDKYQRHSESTSGYYTRYPPLSAIWNGWLMKIGGTEKVLKSVSVILSGLALLFAYLTFSFFFSKRASFLAMAMIGASVGFLDFIDCLSPYLYSEFFRFAGLYCFLQSKKIKSVALAGITWVILLLESFNSFDYIFFFQIFFFLYYWLIENRRPIGKTIFWLTAPALGLGIHYIQGYLVGRDLGFNAFHTLTSGLAFKTIPWEWSKIPSFLAYFCRTMESHFVQNFGFGFGVLFLQLAVCLTFDRGLVKKFLLFSLPCLAWWIVFPNQSASFFNTALHALPIVGCAFGLAIDMALKNRLWLILVGCLWSPILHTGKYLKEYPNLFPGRTQWAGFKGKSNSEVADMIAICKRLKNKTNYGDIILVPFQPDQPLYLTVDQEYFYEYYSGRRMDYFPATTEGLSEKLAKIESYRGSKYVTNRNFQIHLFSQ